MVPRKKVWETLLERTDGRVLERTDGRVLERTDGRVLERTARLTGNSPEHSMSVGNLQAL